MWELTALFLAGLSLFFSGVNGVKSHLQLLSGRRFRLVMARVTDQPVLAGLIGVAFGAITQSASAAAFILSGMVSAGLVTLRRALPVVAAANVGTAVLVFLAAIDIRLAALFLIGLSGLAINFRLLPKRQVLLGALFALGLLFFGLNLMKQAFQPLPGFSWFQALAAFLQSWPLATFFLGIALRMVIQSSSAIGVIAIALQGGGVFTEFQSAMLICGMGPGVALAGFFLSGNMQGPPRQIVYFLGLINLASGLTLALLFMTSEWFSHSFLFALLDTVSRGPSDRIAWTYLALMSGSLLLGWILTPFIEPLLRRLSPPSLEQDLSRPKFLREDALTDPATAIELVEQEQLRIFDLNLHALDTVRTEGTGPSGDISTFLAASLALRREVHEFLTELVQRNISDKVASSILSLEHRQKNLNALADVLNEFVEIAEPFSKNKELGAAMERMTESLHLILSTAHDCWISGDAMDHAILMKLTEDRGDLMKRLRQTYPSSEATLDETSALSFATTLFERLVWLLRQLGASLSQSVDEPE